MITLFWVPSKRYPMGNYKVECVLHQTNKQNSARARRTKNTYSSKVHPIYGCTLCSFTEPFSGASGGRARRARRALVRVTCLSSRGPRAKLEVCIKHPVFEENAFVTRADGPCLRMVNALSAFDFHNSLGKLVYLCARLKIGTVASRTQSATARATGLCRLNKKFTSLSAELE